MTTIEGINVMPSRKAGLRGRLPVKPPGDRFPLRWAHEYLTAPLAPPSYPIDVTGGITAFGMLGNADVGDCGEAGIRHVEMTTAVAAGQSVPNFTDTEALAEYYAFTGGPDTGVNLADFLLWLFNKGRIKAFAPVDHNNAAYIDSFMAEFHGLYCGVNLTDDANSLFNQGQPWTVANGETADPNEGHCIEKVGAEGPAGRDTWVTWGAKQYSTTGWSAACVEEVWVVATTEEQAAKFDSALIAEIHAIGGTVGPTPSPAVTPVPVPAGAQGLFQEIKEFAQDVEERVGTWWRSVRDVSVGPGTQPPKSGGQEVS